MTEIQKFFVVSVSGLVSFALGKTLVAFVFQLLRIRCAPNAHFLLLISVIRALLADLEQFLDAVAR